MTCGGAFLDPDFIHGMESTIMLGLSDIGASLTSTHSQNPEISAVVKDSFDEVMAFVGQHFTADESGHPLSEEEVRNNVKNVFLCAVCCH